jgi:hypothetical protein
VQKTQVLPRTVLLPDRGLGAQAVVEMSHLGIPSSTLHARK